MCLWAVGLVSFENLSEQKKKEIRQDLEQRRQTLKARLGAVTKILREVSQKSKRSPTGRRRRRRRGRKS
jgi:hypothetical protein